MEEATLKKELLGAIKDGNEAKSRQILLREEVPPTLKNKAVMLSAHLGHLPVCQLLLQLGADVNGTTEMGESALMLAAGQGHTEICRLLLESNADVRLKDNLQRSALHYAFYKGSLALYQLLIQHGADVNDKAENGLSVLRLTVVQGYLEVCRWLLQNGADVTLKDDHGNTAFLAAAQEGHLSLCQLLLQHGADVNEKGENGVRAILAAARRGNTSVCQWLLQNNAEVGSKDNQGFTAFHAAAQEGHLSVCQLLLQHGATVNEGDNCGVSALMLSAGRGHINVCLWLLQNGANANLKNDDGISALLLASEQGKLEPCQLLLIQNGVDVNDKDENGVTALMLSARKGHVNVFKLLLANGAHLTAKSKNFSSALTLAVQSHHMDIVELILEQNPPPEFLNLVSTHGMSAIHLAASGGNPRMAKRLLEAGANVNLQGRGDHNQSGRTPLCEAVTYNRLEMVQFLISRPDIIWGQEEKTNLNPFWIACSNGDKNIVEVLFKAKPQMLKVGCPSPLWIACCNFRPSCAAFLLELLTPEDVALPGPDGTTALMQLFANAYKHQDLALVQNDLEIILDMFTLEKFGLNSVLEASIYYGNVPVFQKFCEMGVTEEECAHFAKLATLSEDPDILQYILKKSPSLKSSCQQTGRNCQSKAIREMLGLPLVQNIKSQLLEVSARFPKFNEDIEPGIKMLPTNTKVVDISQDIEPLLKEPFCGLLHSYQKNPKKMPISKWKRHSCTQTHKRDNGCEILNDMMDCTKALSDQFGDASKHPAMGMLKPDLSLVGSMPEGTRAGDVVEIDVMMNLAGFKKEFLRMSQSATELVLSGEGKGFFSTIQETASCGSLFDQQSGFFHYGVLFKFLLSTTAQAYWDIEKENKLPTGIEIGIHNRNFSPCKDCLVTPDDPITHCQKCIPVVTHTRQGLCVLLKGHGKVLIMDLIPVLPSPQEVTEPLMRMYRLITTSLLNEKHPGWKKAFMAYFTKDKVLPDEMHQLTQPEENDSPDDRYILIKLMHYGPEPNYQIRATQSIDAISKLTSEHADCLSYQYAKTLTKLLGIQDVSSYLMKKAFLSRTNYLRGTMTIHQNGEQQRWNLYNIITSPELKKFFASKLDFENPKFPEKLALDGIILLKDDL